MTLKCHILFLVIVKLNVIKFSEIKGFPQYGFG